MTKLKQDFDHIPHSDNSKWFALVLFVIVLAAMFFATCWFIKGIIELIPKIF
jgi:hypothetical protein